MSYYVYYGGELYHYGVLGMKWGVRRFQNRDGSLNSAGRKRYASYENKVDSLSTKLGKVEARKAKITDRYNTVGHARQEARAAKLKAKRDRMEPKVNKLKTKVLRGKDPGFFGKRKLAEAYKLDKKIAKSSRAKDKFDEQISKLNVQETKIQKKIDKYNKKISKLDKAQVELGQKFSASFSSMTPAQVTAYRKEHAKDQQAYLNETQKKFVKAADNVASTWQKSNYDSGLYITMREGRRLMLEEPSKHSQKEHANAERNLQAQKEKADKSHDAFVKANNYGYAVYNDRERTIDELNSGSYEVTTKGKGRHKKYKVRYTG